LNESALTHANLGAVPNDDLSKMEQMEKGCNPERNESIASPFMKS
jgi:hypothetical protein